MPAPRTVLMITLCFTFLAGIAGVAVSHRRRVSRRSHERGQRSRFRPHARGAQAIDSGTWLAAESAVVDAVQRVSRVASTATRLLAANGDTGSVSAMTIDDNRVTVSVTITTTGRAATGTASATAVVGVDGTAALRSFVFTSTSQRLRTRAIGRSVLVAMSVVAIVVGLPAVRWSPLCSASATPRRCMA